jgi:hypothetical protein
VNSWVRGASLMRPRRGMVAMWVYFIGATCGQIIKIFYMWMWGSIVPIFLQGIDW